MRWLIVAKEVLQLLGAGATLLVMVGKFVKFSVKLYIMVSEKNLKLNGDRERERTEMERVFHERDK